MAKIKVPLVFPSRRFGMNSTIMQQNSKLFALLLLVVNLAVVSSCSTRPDVRVNPDQYPFLKPSNGPDKMYWYREQGPDFATYYGVTKTRTLGGLGFYLGEHPDFAPKENSKITAGMLGVFPVEWHESANESLNTDGARYSRTALLDYKTVVTKAHEKESRSTVKILVWISANTEKELDNMTAYAAGLALFSRKPADEVRGAN
jgi:hypothetical protein